MAAFGSKIDNPVRALNDIEMMFDHEDRVSGIHQPLQTIQQALNIGQMQPGRGFIENVQIMPAAAHLAQLGREFDALGLASRKNGGGMAQFKVTEAQARAMFPTFGRSRVDQRKKPRFPQSTI